MIKEAQKEKQTSKKLDIKDDQDLYVRLFKGLANLQTIHDKIEKDDRFLVDPNNPFIDNGKPMSERFEDMGDEYKQKTDYLIEMMKDSGLL